MKTPLIILLGFVCLCCGCGKPSGVPKALPSQYPVLTLDILTNISDRRLEGAILDHIQGKIGEDEAHTYNIVTSMSKGFQMVYATWWVESEVNNGGFNQYFWNQSGEFRAEAVDGYKLIGAAEHEKILSEAIKVYGTIEGSLKKQQEKGTTKAFSESYKDNPLNKLDEQFYKLEEDAYALRVLYIRAHPEEFVSEAPAPAATTP